MPLLLITMPSLRYAIAKVVSSLIAAFRCSIAWRMSPPRSSSRLPAAYSLSASSDPVVTCSRGGSLRISRSDSPIRSRSFFDSRSMAGMSCAPSAALSRKATSSSPVTASVRRATTRYAVPSCWTSPLTIALMPSRCATSRASAVSSRAVLGRSMRCSVCRIAPSWVSVTTLDCRRSVRNASVTTAAIDVSAPRPAKSATRICSWSRSLPAAISDAPGPMPSARSITNPDTASAYATSVPAVATAAWRQVGLTRGTGVPRGVTSWEACLCRHAVTANSGNPMASSSVAPVNTQSGSANSSTATFASPAVSAAAVTYSPKARRPVPPTGSIEASGPSSTVVMRARPEPVVVTRSSASTISLASCGRSSGFFARHRMTSDASSLESSGRCARIVCGRSVRCATSSSCAGREWNGGRPVSISYAITPNA